MIKRGFAHMRIQLASDSCISFLFAIISDFSVFVRTTDDD
jgi:hypothetical protein